MVFEIRYIFPKTGAFTEDSIFTQIEHGIPNFDFKEHGIANYRITNVRYAADFASTFSKVYSRSFVIFRPLNTNLRQITHNERSINIEQHVITLLKC